MGQLRRRGLAAAVTAIFFGISLPAAAAGGDPFTIADLPVDVTASTSTAAREQALGEAPQRALRLLLERLTLQADHGFLPTLAPMAVDQYVRGLEVADERSSQVRYIARVTTRFRPDAVRTLLRQQRLAYAETMTPPLLLLPVYEWAGSKTLWDEPNPWRAAWQAPSVGGLVAIALPQGDLSDAATLSPEQAVAGESDRILAVAGRYEMGHALVVEARYGVDPSSGGPGLDVRVVPHGDGLEMLQVRVQVPARPDEPIESLAARGVEEVRASIEETWKRANLIAVQQEEDVLVAAAPLRELEDLVALRRALAEMPIVSGHELLSLSRSRAQLRIRYVGGPDRLGAGLSRVGLGLVPDGPEGWTIQHSVGSDAARGPVTGPR